jgi:hypothetical protein
MLTSPSCSGILFSGATEVSPEGEVLFRHSTCKRGDWRQRFMGASAEMVTTE